MKQSIYYILALILSISCTEKEKEISSIDPENWEKRMISEFPKDSLILGQTYLSVYAQVYSQTELKTLGMTATVSLRNTDLKDTIYIDKAIYYDTQGKAIRSYFDKPIYLKPMETVDIVIDEMDNIGGTGANFLFDWRTKLETSEPLFESVMISTSGKQGLSFSMEGKRIR